MNELITYTELLRREFAATIFHLCDKHTASVHSWYRTAKHNTSVGGKPNSYHLKGLAADLVCDDPLAMQQLIIEARGLNLIAVNEGDHVHVQTKPHPLVI